MTEQVTGLTERLAAFIAGTDRDDIPPEAFEHGKVAFMDWVAVTLAGKDDPLVGKLIAYADAMGGNQQASILGHGTKKTLAQAALINGSASHALDYDDTLAAFLGHPSVTLFPSLLALAEWEEKRGVEFLTAYLVGLEVGVAVARRAGVQHYMAGWHGTSTIGHLASAAGCARLLELDVEHSTYALGIAATQSSGLKRVFGTMCKPFHAGKASQAGLMSAWLAAEGFTSARDILEGPQGFFEVLQGSDKEDGLSLLGKEWAVRDLSQKYHASCHATHSPLEAALTVVKENQVPLESIAEIRVYSSQLALDAAGKHEPRTGLEGKFSIPYCIANALLRGQTGMQAFTDEKVRDGKVRDMMQKIHVFHEPDFKTLEARVEVETLSGEVLCCFSDILQQIPPLEVKRDRVRDKYFDLAGPILGERRALEIAESILELDGLPSMKAIAEGL